MKRIALAWAALLGLAAASLGFAYLPLGAGNLIAGMTIAALKTAIVAVVFMELGRATWLARLAIAAALGAALLLAVLTALDEATRPVDPAPVSGPVAGWSPPCHGAWPRCPSSITTHRGPPRREVRRTVRARVLVPCPRQDGGDGVPHRHPRLLRDPPLG